ncbi:MULTISPECIES: glutathione S-transferase family protein [unclassified Sphingomonas]|uniref:glutathione S-transferase family protein n=1 Tax=unclassified Sphingomonas TaxID=196159 RepID=UPI0006FA998A|nr:MULTISPECIES: glutathione S-transferase family protein [unclassified Sphingomonas]KQX25931.1 glutathione S-transferase [Sphingomonas sp. Root1294]KQY68996.1 glutathione S-transferase [Sphingomonas sp. Root50]KRB89251.1 glutathione S-transferase [Sphingomonas sp. Root720]
MNDELVFYGNPRSRAQMVHFMLEELGVPYRPVVVDFQNGESRQPDYLAVNPMGKVPAIVHRGVTVTETGAIIAYLADAFPQAGLAPAIDDPARGTWLRWLFFGAGVFEPALLDKMMQRPEAPRATAGYGSYEDALHAIEAMLQPGPWILGERFSAADVYMGSELSWAASFNAPDIADNPRIAAYIERVRARPAYQRTVSA